MRILKILPGSGGTFYCENCMRDVMLTKSLRAMGHDVVLAPMYLPMYTDDPDIARNSPVFYGGINAYLQHKFSLFRKTPRWLDRFFDSPLVLHSAAKRDGWTAAYGMGRMTLSVLTGRDGHHVKELERLVDWLTAIEKPDVVHLSMVLLIGVGPRIREALGVPIVCSLMDENVWVDALDEPYDRQCWEAMRARVDCVDEFMAASEWYGNMMRERLDLDPERLHIVHPGIDLAGFRKMDLSFDPPVIGYLSKITPSLGIETLVDAFILLKRQPGLERLRLRALGGITGRDVRLVATLKKRLSSAGFGEDVVFLPEVDRASRLRFLESLSVLSVPMPPGEAFGTFMFEAWGMGIPVVQPRAGAFPEMIGLTGGGIAYEGEGPGALAGALESVLRDPGQARRMGAAGRKAVVERFNSETVAKDILSAYERVVKPE